MTLTLDKPWSNIHTAHRLIIIDICAELFEMWKWKIPICCNIGKGIHLLKWKSRLLNLVKGLSHTMFNLELWPWHWTDLGQTYALHIDASNLTFVELFVNPTRGSKYESESDIFGPNGNLSDIKNLVSFERKMFQESSYRYKIKKSYYLCQYNHFEIHAKNIINGVHVNYMAITV